MRKTRAGYGAVATAAEAPECVETTRGAPVAGPWFGGWYLLLPVFFLASLRGFWAPDEPRYAQVAREAFEAEFFVMHLNGELYPDKPPLVFWLAGALGRVFEWNEFAMRIPSIFATLLTAWIAARLARRLWGELEARWTPFFALGTVMVIEIGGRLQLDPVLACLCLGSVERATDARGTREAQTRARLLAGVLAGLAALAKGPVAWLHVGVGVLALHGGGGGRHDPARATAAPSRWTWWGFALLAVLPVLGWAALASSQDPRLVGPLFFGQHIGRVVEGAAHRGPPWEHLAHFPLYFLPFTPFFVAGLVRAARERRSPAPDRALRAVVVWFVVLFVVFSAMPPKRDLYLLPIYPAAALVSARVVAMALTAEQPIARAFGLASAFAWMLAGASGLAIVALAAFSEPWTSSTGMHTAAGIAPPWAFVAKHALKIGFVLFAVAVGGAVAWRAFAGARIARGLDALGLSTAIAAVLAAVFVVPAIDPMKCARELALELARRPERPTTLVCVGVQPEGYRFYGRVPAVKGDLAPALDREGENFLALVARKNWDLLPETLRARLRVLDSVAVGAREVLVVGRAPAEGR